MDSSTAPSTGPKRKRWKLDFDIPKSINLPGVRIAVKLEAPSEDSRAANNHGMWLYDLDKDRAAIIIDKEVPIEVQRYVLLHELLHAVHEALDLALEEFPQYVHPKSWHPKDQPLDPQPQ